MCYYEWVWYVGLQSRCVITYQLIGSKTKYKIIMQKSWRGLRRIQKASHVNCSRCVSRFSTPPRPRRRSSILNQELAAAGVRMGVSVKDPTHSNENYCKDRANCGDKACAGFLRLQLSDRGRIARRFVFRCGIHWGQCRWSVDIEGGTFLHVVRNLTLIATWKCFKWESCSKLDQLLDSPALVHSWRFRSTPLEQRFNDGHQLHLNFMSFTRHDAQSVKLWHVWSGVSLKLSCVLRVKVSQSWNEVKIYLIIVKLVIRGPGKFTRWYSKIVFRRAW